MKHGLLGFNVNVETTWRTQQATDRTIKIPSRRNQPKTRANMIKSNDNFVARATNNSSRKSIKELP